MHVALRERDRDALSVEALLHFLHEVEIDTPIVSRGTPRTNHEVNTAIVERRNRNLRRRIFEDSVIFSDARLDDVFTLI